MDYSVTKTQTAGITFQMQEVVSAVDTRYLKLVL
jgi:hypothetical protein